jgi:hypothetical protein
VNIENMITSHRHLFHSKNICPPPLPYFKVNIYPFPLLHFTSIFFTYRYVDIFNLKNKTCGSNNEYWYFWRNKSSKLPSRKSYVYFLYMITSHRHLFHSKNICPPPLPYFKVNIYPFPLLHFTSIFFTYLWSYNWVSERITDKWKILRWSGEGEKGRCLPWSKEEEGGIYFFIASKISIFVVGTTCLVFQIKNVHVPVHTCIVSYDKRASRGRLITPTVITPTVITPTVISPTLITPTVIISPTVITPTLINTPSKLLSRKSYVYFLLRYELINN